MNRGKSVRATPEKRLSGNDGDFLFGGRLVLKLDDPFDQCVDRMVFAHTHAVAGMDFGAALSNDDVAGNDMLAAEFLHAQPSSGGVAVILG